MRRVTRCVSTLGRGTSERLRSGTFDVRQRAAAGRVSYFFHFSSFTGHSTDVAREMRRRRLETALDLWVRTTVPDPDVPPSTVARVAPADGRRGARDVWDGLG